MTHYYLYIKAGLEIDLETRFYKVAVGTGVYAQKLHSWLEAYANEHGHFFVLWSADAADFYAKCRDQIGPGAAPIIGIDAAALKNSLKSGCDDPAQWQGLQHRHHLLMQIDSAYYCYNTLKKHKRWMISDEY